MNNYQVNGLIQMAAELEPGDSIIIEVSSQWQGISLLEKFDEEKTNLIKTGMDFDTFLTIKGPFEADGKQHMILKCEELPKVIILSINGSSEVAKVKELI